MYKNGLIREIRLISKLITSQSGQQTDEKHMLSNISRNKGSQTMKFGQLIAYNIITFFLKNHTQSVVEKLFPDPFRKIQIEHISGSIV